MSALLLGASISSLSLDNQNKLVWFVIVFPVAVLGAFLWLVAKHHKKLYSPSDFRSDEGFLSEPGSPQSLGIKFAQEVDAITDVTETEIKTDENKAGGENAHPAESLQSSKVEAHLPAVERRRAAVATAYLAESLVFRELQSEFGGGVQQHVRIRNSSGRFVEIDGLIDNPDGSYIVETKLVRSQADIGKRVRDAVSHLERIRSDTGEYSLASKGLIALVLTGDVDEISARRRAFILVQSSSMPMTVRVYRIESLLEKYGFEDLNPLE